ncbi:jg2310 [Pararge aegeria aegeria]|uniref:Jg2310 protein n=1 Tax=Pararge aegeria aegeria TaxID=348720 RepID=A0A8S4S4S5_9NEOP|nr:jg2310 [Pararge aegeria aegeria]
MYYRQTGIHKAVIDLSTVKKEATERDRERANPARRRQRPRAGANHARSPAQYSPPRREDIRVENGLTGTSSHVINSTYDT